MDQAERATRLENLKKLCLNNPSFSNERHCSELEMEYALLVVKYKNLGLTPEETVHFERILAMYAIKLAKDSKVQKARELLQDIKALAMDDLIERLLKPIFCQSNLSHSWQDFISFK